ncbi:hypothetical protein F2Q68_00030334 [Brassica cretica]|uniref:USP domain-containing protein n=1 Tax=Brassica cretica TaxID=69181 RepID=A0A8S9GDK9_BRACR|nr:hypothetical protein F2Q68_00030334 [Brassica cretica]
MKKQFEISIVSAVRTYQMIENKYDLFLGPSRMQKLSKEWFMSAMPDESVGRVKERVRPLQLVEESPIVRDLQVGSTTQGFNGKRCDVWWTAYYKESFVVHEKCKWVDAFRQRYEKTWDFPINDIDRSKYLKNKIETFADFPTKDIDKNKNGESCLYDLYALSNHYSGGHYTAHAKLIDDYKWYHFDDSHAHP